MNFVKYCFEHKYTFPYSKDMPDRLSFNKCFDLRHNGDIIRLNMKKMDQIINVFQCRSDCNIFYICNSVYGSDLVNFIDNIVQGKIFISNDDMPIFIIYLILKKYNVCFDSSFIKLFNFIHIERYFEQIRSYLNIISLAEYIILFKYPNSIVESEPILPMYLLNRGEKLLYNPSRFDLSCLKKALVKNNFNLASKLICLGCNLYENEESFKNSALFYAMYFRNRPASFKGICEISDKQWNVIKLILLKCKKLNYPIDPMCLRMYYNPIYKISCHIPDSNSSSAFGKLDFESYGIKSICPFAYALSGYSPSKLDFIIKSHPEFFEAVKQYEKIYTILTQEYMKFM